MTAKRRYLKNTVISASYDVQVIFTVNLFNGFWISDESSDVTPDYPRQIANEGQSVKVLDNCREVTQSRTRRKALKTQKTGFLHVNCSTYD